MRSRMMLIVFGLNALSTRAYGEGEFWLSAVKVAAVVIFLVLLILGLTIFRV